MYHEPAFFEDVPRNVPTLWIIARGCFHHSACSSSCFLRFHNTYGWHKKKFNGGCVGGVVFPGYHERRSEKDLEGG
jgi:hypothetical protein